MNPQFDDRLLPLAALATYCGLSVGTLRRHLDGPPGEALPRYGLGGKIVVKRSGYDGWVQQFRSSRLPRR